MKAAARRESMKAVIQAAAVMERFYPRHYGHLLPEEREAACLRTAWLKSRFAPKMKCR